MIEKSELEILFPNGVDVVIKGEVFNIKPFTLGKIPKVAKLANPIAPYLANSDILGAISDGGDNIIEIAALAIGREKEFLDDIDLDVAVDLFKSIIDVNKDLFEKKILPMVIKKKEEVKVSEEAGLNSIKN